MFRILLLDDEADLREEVAEYLRGLYYEVDEAASLREFDRKTSQSSYDVVILDRILPDGDSLDRVDEFRMQHPQCGVVLFSARDASKDRINGYKAGADHYVTKPVRMDELAAIVQTMARRIHTARQWTLNESAWELISPHNQSIKLTSQEHAFLKLLAQNPSRTVSRNSIVDALGKSRDSYDPRNIDALVLRLRKKISDITDVPMPIKTVHGVGYSLSTPIAIH